MDIEHRGHITEQIPLVGGPRFRELFSTPSGLRPTLTLRRQVVAARAQTFPSALPLE